MYTALQMYKTNFRVVLWSQEGPTFQKNKIKRASSSFLDIIHNTEYSKCGIKFWCLERFLKKKQQQQQKKNLLLFSRKQDAKHVFIFTWL